MLDLPRQDGIPFQFMELNWNPSGHEPEGVYANVAKFRSRLDALAGPGIPIEVTEIGWTTTDTPESRRATYLQEVTNRLARSNCGVERVVPYAWLGPEQDSGDRELSLGWPERDGQGDRFPMRIDGFDGHEG